MVRNMTGTLKKMYWVNRITDDIFCETYKMNPEV